MAGATLNIECDAKLLIAAISELDLYVEYLPSYIRERLIQYLFDGDNLSTGLTCIESQPAADKQTLVVFLKPSCRFLDLLAACRAGMLHEFLIKQTSDKGNIKT